MPETAIQIAQRHERESEDRVVRQDLLVGQLWRAGHSTVMAEDLLCIYKANLQRHRDQLEEIRQLR
jgi:hypothetical protein